MKYIQCMYTFLVSCIEIVCVVNCVVYCVKTDCTLIHYTNVILETISVQF